MDLSLVKSHILELRRLLSEELNNPIFAELTVKLDTLLNNSPLKDIKELHLTPVYVLQEERRRRHAVENLLQQIQKNPAYPDEVKADIAKAYEESMKKYHTEKENLRQTRKQATGEAG